MYRINRTGRNVLITPDEVLFHAPTDQKIDERQILQNIIIAEERFISVSICDGFYEDFIEKKNRKVTINNRLDLVSKINKSLTNEGKKTISENDLPIGTIVNAIEFVENEWYVKLWERFLWKLTAECVDIMTIVPSWVRHTSVGQQMNNPNTIGGNNSGSATAGLKDIQFKIESSMQDRIDPLKERMELWICKNIANFPLYCKPCNSCGCGDENIQQEGVSHIRKTNFVTGLYD